MPYQVEETGELSRVAAVTVTAQEYRKQVNKALKQLSNRVKVPGFRKGNIPLSVMHQRYGDAVTRDVIEELVQKYISEIVTEAKSILHLGTPEITSVPMKDKGDLEFKVNFELRPEIDPIGYLGLEVEKPTVEISDEDIDEQLETARQNAADLKPIEGRDVIQTGDIVVVDFEAVGDHPELEKLKGENAQIEIGAGGALPGVDEALEGAKLGDVVDAEITTDENFPIEEFRNAPLPIKFTVKELNQSVVPELDDEFAKTQNFETLDEWRASIRQQLEAQREHEAEHIAQDNLVKKLIEQNPIELPPLFAEEQVDRSLQNRLQSLQRQGVSLEQLGGDLEGLKDSIREETHEQIKAEFILNAIAQKDNLQVNEEDLKAYFQHQSMHMGMPAAQIEAFMRQDADRMQQVQAMALIEKTTKYLLSEAAIKEVAWPVEEPVDVQDESADEE